MMLNSYTHQDPVLEIKRDGFLAAGKEIRDDLADLYKLLICKTKHIHANLLFTTDYGYQILTGICRHVTYVNPSVMNTSWKDLAVKLGYNDVDVKCINNLRGNTYDPSELVLQYYAATRKEGTLGGILQALLELGFFPALHQVQKHIDSFLLEVETKNANIIEAPSDIEELEVKKILKAADFKPFVPAIFDSISSKKDIVQTRCFGGSKEGEVLQRCPAPSKTHSKTKHKQYCKYVMLSFASDGHATANKVASVLRTTTNKKGLPIGVLLLCENEDKIQGNPGKMITELISKMDFVVPVLTEGYFSALKEPDLQSRLLDERYIQFIHNILLSKYIHNNCRNTQVRSIIPRQTANSIHMKPEFTHNSIFNAWKTDDEIATLADNIIKSHRSKCSP